MYEEDGENQQEEYEMLIQHVKGSSRMILYADQSQCGRLLL